MVLIRDSLLGPIFANIFLSQHEDNWLDKCPVEFKPTFYRRYVLIFSYFLNHRNLPPRLANICPLNTRKQISALNVKILTHFCFQMLKVIIKMVNLSIAFTESQQLVEFSPIMEVSFQHSKKEDLCTLLNGRLSIFCDFKAFHLELENLRTILRKKFFSNFY